MTFKVNILWLVCGFKEKWLRTEKGQLDCRKCSYIIWFLCFFGHNVLLYCLKLVGVRKKKWRPQWDFSIEALHMILCEKITQLQVKKAAFFQFWGHNVPITCSEVLGVINETWSPSYKLSMEILHLILCEEKIQLQTKTSAFFSFGVMTSPYIAHSS